MNTCEDNAAPKPLRDRTVRETSMTGIRTGHPITAMILAAGLGTRLKPLTDTMPKALVPYEGVPMIERLMLRLREAGFTRAIINVHHFAGMLESFVRSHDGFGLEVAFSDERDLLRDTGGGIRHAVTSGLLGDAPVLVHNVDIVTSGIDLRRFYTDACTADSTGSSSAATLLVSNRTSSRHLLTGQDGLLQGWEYPAKGLVKGIGNGNTVPASGPDTSSLVPRAFSGIHVLSPEALQLLRPWPEVFSIIDFYLSIAASHTVRCIGAPADAVVTDIGKLTQLH